MNIIRQSVFVTILRDINYKQKQPPKHPSAVAPTISNNSATPVMDAPNLSETKLAPYLFAGIP